MITTAQLLINLEKRLEIRSAYLMRLYELVKRHPEWIESDPELRVLLEEIHTGIGRVVCQKYGREEW